MEKPKWFKRLHDKIMAQAQRTVDEQSKAAEEEAIERAQLLNNSPTIPAGQLSQDQWEFTIDVGGNGKLICKYYPDSVIQRAIKIYLNMPIPTDEDLREEAERRGAKPEQIEEIIADWRQEVEFLAKERISKAEYVARRHLLSNLPGALLETLSELSIHVMLLTAHTMLKMPEVKKRLNDVSNRRRQYSQQRLGAGKGRFLDMTTFAIEHKEAVERLFQRGEDRTPNNIAKEMGYQNVRGFNKALKSLGFKSNGDKGLSVREEKVDELLKQKRELNQQD